MLWRQRFYRRHGPARTAPLPFLPRRDVDVAALGVGQGVELGGLGRVVMDLDVVKGDAGQRLNACLELIRQAGAVRLGPGCRALLTLRGHAGAVLEAVEQGLLLQHERTARDLDRRLGATHRTRRA